MMAIFFYIMVGLIGLVLGSFLAALTYRLPLGISIQKGRSKCPSCKETISWYDNIPLLSYILLSGKCRHCKKHISLRYPFIEALTAILFLVISLLSKQIVGNIVWLNGLPNLIAVSYLLFITFLLIGIFVTDIEHQIILDEMVFIGIGVTLFMLLLSDYGMLYSQLLGGLVTSLFFFFLWAITRGRGMGMGDIKLALFIGLIIGPRLSVVWVFLSFVTGAFIGLLLLAGKKKKMQSKIAFGPFMVVATLLVVFFGNLLQRFFPLP